MGRARALGTRDGRVVLYLREHVRELLPPPSAGSQEESIQTAILEQLAQRGALFLFEIEDAVKARLGELSSQDFKEALWDLVWSGQVSNDTFAPLRALGQRASRSRAGRPGGPYIPSGNVGRIGPGST